MQPNLRKVISEKATTIANLQELIGSTENRIEKLTAAGQNRWRTSFWFKGISVIRRHAKLS